MKEDNGEPRCLCVGGRTDGCPIHGDEPDFYQFDKHALDEEWEKQPRLFWKYATVLADKKADAERARADEKVVYAEVEEAFRLERIDDAKLRESAVKAAVLTSKRYKRAVESRILAEKDADYAKVAVDTLDHRKRALENEVQLFLASYFAKPREPKDRQGDVDMMRKRKLRNPE